MYSKICDALHQELETLDERYANGGKINSSDLEIIDKATHALKCLKTYEAMEGNSEYGSYDDGSYARGRSRTTGRYVSRDESRDYRRY